MIDEVDKMLEFPYFINPHAVGLLEILLSKTIKKVSVCVPHEVLHRLSHMS